MFLFHNPSYTDSLIPSVNNSDTNERLCRCGAALVRTSVAGFDLSHLFRNDSIFYPDDIEMEMHDSGGFSLFCLDDVNCYPMGVQYPCVENIPACVSSGPTSLHIFIFLSQYLTAWLSAF